MCGASYRRMGTASAAATCLHGSKTLAALQHGMPARPRPRRDTRIRCRVLRYPVPGSPILRGLSSFLMRSFSSRFCSSLQCRE